jgi:hypothetical protein
LSLLLKSVVKPVCRALPLQIAARACDGEHIALKGTSHTDQVFAHGADVHSIAANALNP